MFTFALGIFAIGFAIVIYFSVKIQESANRPADNEMVELLENQLKPVLRD